MTVPMHSPVVRDYGPAAEHDVACAVCGSTKAVLDLDAGVFLPCWNCQRARWTLTVKRPWWSRLHAWFGAGA